jgi:putative DNA primase/helicase
MDLNDLDVSAMQPAASPLPTEVALADEFATRHAHDLRYFAKWGRWMQYEGGRWKEEETFYAFDEARKVCVEFARGLNKPSEIKTVLSAKTVAAVEKLAKADRRIAATVEQWDQNLWLLNTPGGTVDLRTGELRPHDPSDYITKMTAVAPGGACPTWRKHLEMVQPSADVRNFLQCYFGSALSGDTTEQQLLFIYGPGANGKTTTVETIGGVIGDYYCTVPMDLFVVSNVTKHPTELAMLVGARLVSANETTQGERWDEAKINQLTGGGAIKARFMRQDFFDLVPQFKLCFTGNHRPRLRSINEANKRRHNLVPFDVIIPKQKRDRKLDEKLRKEWSGILQWLIDGCLEWQRVGLRAPKEINEATAAYFESEDTIATWITEELAHDATSWVSTKELFSNFKKWCEENGEHYGTEKRLSAALFDRRAEFRIDRKKGPRDWRNPDHGKRAEPKDMSTVNGFWGLTIVM